jgi:hypothetical protein
MLTDNQTYGAGVGSGARLTASKSKFSRNQVGMISKGTDSIAQLFDCEVRRSTSCSAALLQFSIPVFGKKKRSVLSFALLTHVCVQIFNNVRIGIGVREAGQAGAVRCKMTRNQYGVCVSNDHSNISLVSCEMSNNHTHGLGVSDGGFANARGCTLSQNQVGVVSRGAGSTVIMTTCAANDNYRIGVGIREGGSAECSKSQMERNQYGVCCLNQSSTVVLSECSASYNGRYGVSSSDGGLVEVRPNFLFRRNVQLD